MDYKKILIIDDEIDICLLLSNLLKKKGYETKYATTISDGKAKFVEFNPQIVFLDLNLPDGSGFKLIPELKKLQSGINIIIISAYDSAREQLRAELEGVQYFISKPLKKETIISTIEQIKTNKQDQL